MFRSASQWFKRHQRRLVVSATLVLLVLFVAPALAQTGEANFGFTNFAGTTALGTNVPLVQTVARVINIALGFLGVLAIIIILYAGYIWMTSRGNEEKIGQAKRIMSAGAIGLAIIFAAYGIASFIVSQLSGATGATGGGGPVGCVGSCFGPPGSREFTVESKYPPQGATNVALCESVQATFNQNVNPTTVNSGTVTVTDITDPLTPVVLSRQYATAANAISVFRPQDFTAGKDYRASISNVQNTDPLTPTTVTSTSWTFTSGNTSDNTLPTVAGGYPTTSGVCRNTPIQAIFSKVMNVATFSLGTSGNITLTGPGGDVPLAGLTVGTQFKDFTVYPATALAKSTTYTVHLKSGKKDLVTGDNIATNGLRDSCMNVLDGNGNTIPDNTPADDYTWTFTTNNSDNVDCHPQLTKVTPIGGYYSDLVTLEGHNLGITGEVAFNSSWATNKRCWGNGAPPLGCGPNPLVEVVQAYVPTPVVPPLHPSLISAIVGLTQQSNPESFEIFSPYIAYLAPDRGPVGQFVSIVGDNFGPSPGTVKFGTQTAVLACGVGSWSQNQIIAKAPVGLLAGNAYDVQVTTAAPAHGSNTLPFAVNTAPLGPGLCEISPTSTDTAAGNLAYLKGYRFGTAQGSSQVKIGSVVGGAAAPWGDQEIDVVPYAGLPDGHHPVTVTVNSIASNPLWFDKPSHPRPQVVENPSCSAATQSPSPANDFTGVGSVCLNAQLAARFTETMASASFAGNIKLQDCTNPGTGAFDVASCTNVALNAPLGSSSGFTVQPTAQFTANHWYQATIGPNVQSQAGATMNVLYPWQFKTGDSVCEVASVGLDNNPARLQYTGAPGITYTAAPQASNCNVLNGSYSWNWSSSNPPRVSLVPAGAQATVQAVSLAPPITMQVTAQLAGTAKQASADLTLDALSCTSSVQCNLCGPGFSSCVAGSCTPVITGFSPPDGAIGTWVGINGCYFGNSLGNVAYAKTGGGTVNGLVPNPAICGSNGWSNTFIMSEVPPLALSGTNTFDVVRPDATRATSPSGFTVNGTVRPGLCAISPSVVYQNDLGTPAAQVVFKGKGYGASDNGSVKANFSPVGLYTPASSPWSDNQIQATAPAGTTTGKVWIDRSGSTSAKLDLEVRPGSSPVMPVISGISPLNGIAQTGVSTVVTIIGTGFGNGGQVFFGSTPAPVADCGSWTDTQITVAAPPLGLGGTLVTVQTSRGTSNAVTFTVNTTIRPGICSVAPVAGSAGTRVTITGRNFTDNRQPSGTVNSFVSLTCPAVGTPASCKSAASLGENPVDATPAKFKLTSSQDITQWSNNQITITTPPEVRTGPLRVTVDYGAGNGGLQTSNGVTFSGEPFITSLTPSTGPAGTWVTVRGGNFGATAGQVTFSGTTSDPLPVFCGSPWTDTQIVVKAPAGGVTGLVKVRTSAGLTTDDPHSQTFTYNPDLPLQPGLCALTLASPNVPPNTPSGPIVALPTTVVLSGDALGSSQGTDDKVVLANIDPAPVVAGSWSNTQVKVTAPPIPTPPDPRVTQSGNVTLQRVASVKVGQKCPLPKVQIGSTCIGGWEDNYQTVTLVSNPLQLSVNTSALVLPPQPLVFQSSIPASGSTICRNTEFRLTFDQALDPASVTTTSVVLNTNGTPVPVTARVSTPPTVLVVDPTTVLLTTQPYRLTVKSGATGLKSLAHGTLAADVVLTFTTGPDICKLDKVTLTPASRTFNTTGEQQVFMASALAPDGNFLSGITYTWSKDDPGSVVGYTATAAQATVTAGQRNGQATLTVTASGAQVGSGTASAALDVFLCEVPWELKDDDYHFRLRYCRAETVQAQASTNQVQNGSFNESGNPLNHWTPQGSGWAASGAGYQDTSAVAMSELWPSTLTQTVGNLKPNTTYVARAYALVDLAGQNVGGGMILTPSTTCADTFNLYSQAARGSSWQPLQVVFNTGPRTDYTVCLYTRGDNSVTAPLVPPVRFDAVSLEEAPNVLPELKVVGPNFGNGDVSREYFFTNSSATDVIGLRIYRSSMSTLSPRQWYQGRADIVKGSLADTLVDGYAAGQGGSTLYVSAVNFCSRASGPGCSISSQPDDGLETDMYVLGYNQGASAVTSAIYQELVASWTFNTNLPTATHPGVQASLKQQLRRDLTRLTDMGSIRSTLDGYAAGHINTVPQLSSGSYLKGQSWSRWYSWAGALSSDLGHGLPVDPINKFGPCTAPGYDPDTCWNATTKTFGSASNTCPDGSHVYGYQAVTGQPSQAKLSFNAEFKSVTWWKGSGEAKIIPAGDACDSAQQPINYEAPVLTVTQLTDPNLGAVTSNEAVPKLSCGGTCSTTYAAGSKVTLTVAPQPGSRFVGWGDACASAGASPTCAVTMTGSLQSVSVSFAAVSYPLTVKVVGGGTVQMNGSPCTSASPCTASYVKGSTVTLTNTTPAASPWVFTGWSSGSCSGLGDCTFTTTPSAQQITATFVPRVNLTVATSTPGGSAGSVALSPAGAACVPGSPGCTAYASGTSVQLTANPGIGSVFSSWSGACASFGNNPTCTLPLSVDASSTATFARASYTLTVAKSGLGSGTVTSTPAGISCGATCSASYSGGSTITPTATPDTDSTFTGWSGDCTGLSCSVTMNQAHSVTANFNPVSYTLTVTKAGVGQGTVASNESTPKISCGAACTGPVTATYLRGTTVVLAATVASQYFFVGWTGNPACGGNGTCTLNVTGNTSVTANFALRSTLRVTTANLGTGGSGTVTSDLPTANPIRCGAGGSHCDEPYELSPTTQVTLTASPAADSIFIGWQVIPGAAGQGNCSGVGFCTVIMNTPDASGGVNVTATFALRAVLKVQKNGSGNGTVVSGEVAPQPKTIDCGSSCTAVYPAGATTVTLTAVEDASSVFTGWSLGTCTTATCTVTMDTDTTVTATFIVAHTVIVKKQVGGVDTTNHAVTSTPARLNCTSGTNNCSARFVAGSNVTLNPSAEVVGGVSYIFDSWSGACSGSGSCPLTVNADLAATATFRVAPSHTLTVTKAGLGGPSGHVASDAAHPGINCDPDCNAQYQEGATIVLTATAGTGTFTSWTGCTSAAGNQCTVKIITSDVAVTATFTAYQLTVNNASAGGGTGVVSSAKIDCGATCSAIYSFNDVVTLSAVATNGGFTGWSGGTGSAVACNGSPSPTCTFTIGATSTIIATFTAVTLTVNRNGTGSGTIDIVPPNSNCSATTCVTTYAPGTSVTLTAKPDPGSSFAGFSGGGCSTSPCTLKVNSATTVTATFNPAVLYSLTVVLQGSGAASSSVTVSPSPGPYAAGTSVQLTATSGPGVTFTGFSGGGCSTSPCTVIMNSNLTVTATFQLIRTLTLTVSGSGTASLSPSPLSGCTTTTTSCTANYADGTLVAVSSSPAVGNILISWGSACSGRGSCTVTMNADTSVTATFGPGFVLTVNKSGSGTVTSVSPPGGISCGADCSEPYPAGTVVALSAAPGSGYIFQNWSGACSGAGTCTVTMNANKTVTATFFKLGT